MSDHTADMVRAMENTLAHIATELGIGAGSVEALLDRIATLKEAESKLDKRDRECQQWMESYETADRERDELVRRLDSEQQRCQEYKRIADRAEVEKQELLDRLVAVRSVVDAQAEDDGLWFEAQTAPEAYLQQELRKLHAAVEGMSPEECVARIVDRQEPTNG